MVLLFAAHLCLVLRVCACVYVCVFEYVFISYLGFDVLFLLQSRKGSYTVCDRLISCYLPVVCWGAGQTRCLRPLGENHPTPGPRG